MSDRTTARLRRRCAAILSLGLGAVLVVGGLPAQANGPSAGPDLPPGTSPLPLPHAGPGTGTGTGAGVQATIENEEDFCGFLTGVYDYKPAYFTVRTINCKSTTTFVKAVYAHGGYGLCLPVPARSSRHLGGSIFKPVEKSQLC